MNGLSSEWMNWQADIQTDRHAVGLLCVCELSFSCCRYLQLLARHPVFRLNESFHQFLDTKEVSVFKLKPITRRLTARMIVWNFQLPPTVTAKKGWVRTLTHAVEEVRFHGCKVCWTHWISAACPVCGIVLYCCDRTWMNSLESNVVLSLTVLWDWRKRAWHLKRCWSHNIVSVSEGSCCYGMTPRRRTDTYTIGGSCD